MGLGTRKWAPDLENAVLRAISGSTYQGSSYLRFPAADNPPDRREMAACYITGGLLFSRWAIGIPWNALREPGLPQRNSAVTKDEIKQWQEDVVSRIRDIVMTHVIGACERSEE